MPVSGRGKGQQAKTDFIEGVLLCTVGNSLNADPWCRALPDFGNMPTNFTQKQRDEYLKKLYSYAHLISAKGMYFNKQGDHLTYDIGACVRTAEASGFKGIYSAEQWSPKPNPIDAVAAARAIIRQIADNI
jgi:hypothetical protein